MRWIDWVVIGAVTMLSSAYAADLTPSAMLLQDTISVNQGHSIQMLTPAKSAAWSDPTPYLLPDDVEIWMAGKNTIKSIGFTVQMAPILAGTLQQWDGAQWYDVVALPTGTGDKVIRLEKPIQARALRLHITQSAKIDHSPMVVRNVRVEGDSAESPFVDQRANLDLSCAAKFNTFDLPASAAVAISIRNADKNDRKYLLRYRWETIYGDPVSGDFAEKDIQLAGGEKKDIPVHFAFQQQGPYRLTADLHDPQDKSLLSRQRILVGVRGKFDEYPSAPANVSASKPESNFWWSAEISQSILGLKHPSSELFFEKTHSAGGNMVNAFLHYGDFEPLPGVYNFQFFDTMVAQARQHQLALTLGVWRWEFNEPSQYWMAQDLLTDEKGNVGTGWNLVYSPWGATYRKHATAAVEAMVARYRHCPEIKIWHPHPYGMVDHAAHTDADYSPAGREAFANWLEKKYVTLDALNAAYGARFNSWMSVPIPKAQWKELKNAGDFAAASRVVDLRPAYVDYIQFWHQDSVLAFRNQMMETVRRLDPDRPFDGTAASAGKPTADTWWRSNQQYKAFAGDQGLNLGHYIRRMVSCRQYGLLQRYEDISPVSPNRFAKGLSERIEWNTFQCAFLGVEHFNYAFPTWDQSPFWDRFFANPQARKMIQQATQAQIAEVPVGYLHSFVTDNLEGCAEFDAITLLRWWTMNGMSRAMTSPGYFFESLNAEGDLSRLSQMKLLIDDGSRVLPSGVVDRLVDYVNAGGKLVLNVDSGQYSAGRSDTRYPLLAKLGYAVTPDLDQRLAGPFNAILTSYDPGATVAGSGDADAVFSRLKVLPLQYIAELKVPTGGRVLGSIQGKPAVVTWNVGKGSVMLFAGRIGSALESTIQQAMQDSAAKGRAYPMWHDAEAEMGILHTALMQDLFAWAGVKPSFEIDGNFVGAIKHDSQTVLVPLLNMGDDDSPVLRMPEEQTWKGRIRVQLDTLDGSLNLGEIDSQELANRGIKLPLIRRQSFALVTVRAPDKTN